MKALMAGQALDAVAEQLETDLALDSMRPGDRSEGDAALAAGIRRHDQACVSSAAPSAGSSVDSPSAATSAPWGESSVGGATSSAPSTGASLDSPSFSASATGAASSATASSAGASSVSGSATTSSSPASA